MDLTGDVKVYADGRKALIILVATRRRKIVFLRLGSLHSGKSEVCPKCSGGMIVRSGRYGKFWGCKNYPKCKGIVKIKK